MLTLPALHRDEDGRAVLCSPQVGLFRTHLAEGDEVNEATVLGHLLVLNRRYRITTPKGVVGVVAAPPEVGVLALGYGDPFLELADRAVGQNDVQKAASERNEKALETGRYVVHSPIDGIFYARSGPKASPYVEAGDRVVPGQVLGLIEVMKTFNPIRYEATGGQEATVRSVEVSDQQEVKAGQQLVVLDPD